MPVWTSVRDRLLALMMAGEKGNGMKVKELVNKVNDFGTNPHIYIQKGGSIIGGGKPDEVSENFGGMKVCSFIAVNRGQIKVFVE